MSTLKTPEGRTEALRKYQDRLANNPRYEPAIGGGYKMKLEEKIRIIESNIRFMLSNDAKKIETNPLSPSSFNTHIINSMINLIQSKSIKIRRDYGI